MAFDFEKFMDGTWGVPRDEWQEARSWMKWHLRKVASRPDGSITYSDLCNELDKKTGVRLEPHGDPLAAILGQINYEEREDGHPLISCVVVHKNGDKKPGVGFWNMAKLMNLDVGATDDDRTIFWAIELGRCYERWGGAKR